MRRIASFLDRDGVIVASRRRGNASPPESVDDVVVPDGVAEGLASLRDDGYALIVVTNQPDVARGTTTRTTVDTINAHIHDELPVDAIYTCFHDVGACACRKPKPGMLLDAARDHDLDLGRSWLIGDRWVDVAAGRAAGVRTVLLERPYSWEATSQGPPPPDLQPDAARPTFAECVTAIREGEL